MYASHAALIDAEGGPRLIAEKIGARSETVRMWRYRRRIPRQNWPELIAAIPSITIEALVASEAAASVPLHRIKHRLPRVATQTKTPTTRNGSKTVEKSGAA